MSPQSATKAKNISSSLKSFFQDQTSNKINEHIIFKEQNVKREKLQDKKQELWSCEITWYNFHLGEILVATFHVSDQVPPDQANVTRRATTFNRKKQVRVTQEVASQASKVGNHWTAWV